MEHSVIQSIWYRLLPKIYYQLTCESAKIKVICHCGFTIDFLVNTYFILQISLAKTFKKWGVLGASSILLDNFCLHKGFSAASLVNWGDNMCECAKPIDFKRSKEGVDGGNIWLFWNLFNCKCHARPKTEKKFLNFQILLYNWDSFLCRNLFQFWKVRTLQVENQALQFLHIIWTKHLSSSHILVCAHVLLR